MSKPEHARHLSMAELEAGLDAILATPKREGTLDWIVRRPAVGEREALASGRLDLDEGLVGDDWKLRGSSRTPDGSAHPEMQLNVMNSRVIALLAREKSRWQLAGDQLFIDLDLGDENLSPGSRLSVGEGVIEVTTLPHTGCKKFAVRFGVDAVKFVNSELGRKHRLRGINAKVVTPGVIRLGDAVKAIPG